MLLCGLAVRPSTSVPATPLVGPLRAISGRTLIVSVWEKLAPYQQNRLKVFLDPSADPRASGYHVIQSKIAIGSGGLFGQGFTMGTQKGRTGLPVVFARTMSPTTGFISALAFLK